MLWAALAYALGIAAGVDAWRPASWWTLAAIAFIVAAAWFIKRRSQFGWALAFGVLFLLGALHIQVRPRSSHFDPSIQRYADRQELEIIAHVTHDGRIQSEPGELRQTLDVETEEIETQTGERIPIHSGIRLSVYVPLLQNSTLQPTQMSPIANVLMRQFHYGERIRISAKLRTPRNFRNPGAFDYRGYLQDHGVAALASAKLENVEILPGFFGNRGKLGGADCIAPSLPRCMNSGLPARLRSSMPWSLARKPLSIAIRASIFSVPELITCWSFPE